MTAMIDLYAELSAKLIFPSDLAHTHLLLEQLSTAQKASQVTPGPAEHVEVCNPWAASLQSRLHAAGWPCSCPTFGIWPAFCQRGCAAQSSCLCAGPLLPLRNLLKPQQKMALVS